MTHKTENICKDKDAPVDSWNALAKVKCPLRYIKRSVLLGKDDAN
jgi:hypothetical protein